MLGWWTRVASEKAASRRWIVSCKQKVDCEFSWVLFCLSVGTTGDGARRTARSQACRVVGLYGERDNGGLGQSRDAGAGNGGTSEQGSELRVELEG